MALRGQVWRSEPVYPAAYPEGGIILAVPVGAGPEPAGAVLAFLSFGPMKARFVRDGKEAAGEGGVAYVGRPRGEAALRERSGGVPAEHEGPLEDRPRPGVHGPARPADEELHPGRGPGGPPRPRDARDGPVDRLGRHRREVGGERLRLGRADDPDLVAPRAPRARPRRPRGPRRRPAPVAPRPRPRREGPFGGGRDSSSSACRCAASTSWRSSPRRSTPCRTRSRSRSTG